MLDRAEREKMRKAITTGKFTRADAAEWIGKLLNHIENTIPTDSEEVARLRAALVEREREIRRLREAAIALHQSLNTYWLGYFEKADVVAAQSKLCDILSTTPETPEPSGADRVRELWRQTVHNADHAETLNQANYYAAKAVGIMDTVKAAGWQIPGINAPDEKEGRT